MLLTRRALYSTQNPTFDDRLRNVIQSAWTTACMLRYVKGERTHLVYVVRGFSFEELFSLLGLKSDIRYCNRLDNVVAYFGVYIFTNILSTDACCQRRMHMGARSRFLRLLT